MINLAIESPNYLLKKVSNITDFDFVIASHCISSDVYYNFFKTREEERKLYLDNGAFELGKSIDSKIYKKIIKELKPSVIVLPDVLNNKEATLRACDSFFESYEDKISLMGVLQGISPVEYIDCLGFYLDKGVKIIGIPYHLFYRPKLIKDYGIDSICNTFNADIHILGLPNPFEVIDLRKIPEIKTIDTSLPVTSAYNSKGFNECKWMKSRLDLNWKFNSFQEELMITNISVLDDFCKDEEFK